MAPRTHRLPAEPADRLRPARPGIPTRSPTRPAHRRARFGGDSTFEKQNAGLMEGDRRRAIL